MGLSYYRSATAEARLQQRLDVQDRIEEIALEFPRYGYRRITAALHGQNCRVNHKVVQDMMRESDHPNRIWVADITYIRLPLCFIYLAVILDVYSRMAIGWALSRRLEAQLALAAQRMAISKRGPFPGCIHHSDGSIQYACGEYTTSLKQHDFRSQIRCLFRHLLYYSQ